VEVCPYHALSLVGGMPVLDTSIECVYCGNCEEVCPTEAIRRPFLVVFGQPSA
jgi:NAD-dependent dihydropyrimidine dehydrogenase PreA subunit